MVGRRQFLGVGAATLAGCASFGDSATPRVLVIGAGFGGATCAKYLAMSDAELQVVLVDRVQEFVSCPMSNLVLGGSRSMPELTLRFDGLKKYGVDVLWGEAIAVDPSRKVVRFGRGSELVYDRLVLSPGVDFVFEEIAGYEAAQPRVLHAWKAGAQTVELRRQLEEMDDGGVCIIGVPPAPYRSPSAPYERACQIAAYLRQAKARSKVLILDANAAIAAEGSQFRQAWQELYPGMVEYRPNSRVLAVDAEKMTVRTGLETIRGDVLNIIPPQRAGDIAYRAGLVARGDRWCDIDWRTMESKAIREIHVLGDATLPAAGMPKSGQMANSQAKVCAAAVDALIRERTPASTFVLEDTGYSFVSDREAIHAASTHRYDARRRTMVEESSMVSPGRSELEARNGWNWARNIWADSFS
ncbi:MAG TPA: FAD/NAD(P)-binding oxidoreductase [Burkholderiales bacterium]|nr:FAD/NAD(P)-binding oxidoreductase [Burkholderiales bacterium]